MKKSNTPCLFNTFQQTSPNPRSKRLPGPETYKEKITISCSSTELLRKKPKESLERFKDKYRLSISTLATLFILSAFASACSLSPIHSVDRMKIPPAQPRIIRESPKIESRTPSEKSLSPTAICRDGSLSYSSSRRGTCSHHKGVLKWIKSKK